MSMRWTRNRWLSSPIGFASRLRGRHWATNCDPGSRLRLSLRQHTEVTYRTAFFGVQKMAILLGCPDPKQGNSESQNTAARSDDQVCGSVWTPCANWRDRPDREQPTKD